MRWKCPPALAAGFLFLGSAIGSPPASAVTIEAKLTADNTYQLWLGDANGVTTLVGQADSCFASDVFSNIETYNISDPPPGTYLYIVAYSDEGGTQGVLGEFTGDGATLLTGDAAWEVFATGVDFDSCGASPFPTASQVNSRITTANAGTGMPTTSGTWVGTAATALGNLAVGEDNSSAGGTFQLVTGITPQARWMWFDAPGPGNPFTTPNQKEALIFRVPVASLAPCAERPADMVGWWPLDETSGITAADLAAYNDGTHVNGPVPAAGQVAGALSFDGVNDFVTVPDDPLLDIGTADFTLDAWVFPEKDTLIKPIVDKMDPATGVGYSLSLVAGNVMTFAWGDAASGFTFAHSSSGTPIGNPAVPVGVWTHVAVTLDRDDPAGGKFYIDGILVNSFNPTFRPGSFASAAPLRIGAGGVFNNGFFDGSIDEVEIFARALDASEIQALYAAGPFGKCKDSLQPGWDYSLCPNEASTVAEPAVCNDSSEPHQYSLSFAGVVGGSPGVPGLCTNGGQGPTSFALLPPDTLPLLVPPRTCRQVKVTVGRPANHAVSEIRCFKVVAQNLDTGAVVQGFSAVYAPANVCGRTVEGNPEIWFDPRPVFFEVRNPGATPVTFPYQFEAVASSMDPDDLITSLNGRAPGTPVSGQVTIPARRSVTLEVEAALVGDGEGGGFEAFNDQDVLLRQAGTGIVLASESLRPTAPGCVPNATELCLNDGRFRVNAAWRVGNDTGLGQAVPLTSDTGYFWFFGPQNVEVVLKVLDGRPLNEHFWVFYGALSDVEYVLTVTDTETGASKTYFNPAGNLASVADTSAIPAAAGSTVSDVEEDEAAIASAAAAAQAELDALLATAPVGTCAPGATALCLQNARFRVEVEWKDFVGNTGVGQAVPLTSDTGYFWFFGANNVELILKVLDGRPLNQRWWVFYGALSSVEYRIVVTDTETARTKTYFNSSGNLASVADTSAFPP